MRKVFHSSKKGGPPPSVLKSGAGPIPNRKTLKADRIAGFSGKVETCGPAAKILPPGAGCGARKEYDFTSRIHNWKAEVLKTRWKGWKVSGKFLSRPTKPVENPVERVKNPPRG